MTTYTEHPTMQPPPTELLPRETREVGIAYLLLILGGLFGAHRFYTRRSGSAIAMLILMVCLVGVLINPVWVLVDALFLADHVDDLNRRIRAAR